MKKLNNKSVGIICVVLGGIFFVAGIVLFILYNYVNLYAKQTDATIVSRYRIESEEDPHTMIELAYRVGDDMVYTTDSIYEEVPDDEVNRTIYYNVKNPKEILDAGWHVEPIIPAFFGILILMTGLYYMGVINFGFDIDQRPSQKASEWDRKFYETKERVENSLIPILGLVSFLVFGIYMVVNKKGWWAWIFIGIGAIGIIYLCMDLIPAMSEFIVLNKMKKYKNKSLSIDEDFEKFSKKKEIEESNTKNQKSQKAQNNKKVSDADFEIEETYEIKSLDVKKKRKKKK